MGLDMKKTGIPRLLVASAMALALVGCWTTAKKEKKKQIGVGSGDSNLSYTWQGFPQPVESPKDAEILVEKMVPKSVRPNQKFRIHISVRNNANYDINDVKVTEQRPDGFKFVKAVPEPSARETALVWNLGRVQAKTKRDIYITGVATKIGTVRYSGETTLTFKVATDDNFASTVHVIQPNLKFFVSAPKTALIETKVPVKLTFKNVGQASVIGAKLVHTLPPGLLTYEGKSRIEREIGNLKPGKVKSIDLDLKGVKTGKYSLALRVEAEEGISATGKMDITITKPVLKITGKAPKKRFVGNPSPYTIKVNNIGDAPADNLVVTLTLPNGVALKSASEGGKISGGKVVWNISTLRPGATKTVSAMTVVKQIMVARAEATAVAKAADKVTAVMQTDVAGIAGLLTTVVDEDPVPVGETTTYTIIANNTGSLDSTDIVIKCELPPELEFVSCAGATKGKAAGNKVVFEALPALAPHSVAKWYVTAKAVKPGDVQFKTMAKSAQLERDVDIFESTHLYK